MADNSFIASTYEDLTDHRRVAIAVSRNAGLHVDPAAAQAPTESITQLEDQAARTGKLDGGRGCDQAGR